MNGRKHPTDLRANQRQAERRLLVAVVVFLVVVGGGLIAAIYGVVDALTGLPCLLVGVGLILLIYILLNLVERWTRDD